MVEGQRKKWIPNRTWKMLVDEESVMVGLSRGDSVCRSMWIFGVSQTAVRLSCIWPPSFVGGTTGC